MVHSHKMQCEKCLRTLPVKYDGCWRTNGKRWYGLVCNDCHRNPKKYKPKILGDKIHVGPTIQNIRCRGCSIIKTRTYIGRTLKGRNQYKATDSRSWNKEHCPDCVDKRNAKNRLAYGMTPRTAIVCQGCGAIVKQKNSIHRFCVECSKKHKSKYTREYVKKRRPLRKCKRCNTLYKSGKNSRIYCSSECKQKPTIIRNCIKCLKEFKVGKQAHKFCSKECSKKEPVLKTEYIKNCIVCNKEFKTNNKYKLACKNQHSPAKYARKQLEKRKLGKAMVKWADRTAIARFYANCPEGYEVDHIIPLNGELVCGLHIVTNLQYLTKEENKLKTGSWDGTLENNGWRCIKVSED